MYCSILILQSSYFPGLSIGTFDAVTIYCDDISSAKAVLIANLSSCNSDVLSKLNKIKEDFGKRFVTQKEFSAEQAFWLKHSNYNPYTSVKSHTPVRIEAPSELPKVSLVNESLKKLKYQLASFDKVGKKRTTSDAIMAGKNVVNTAVSKPSATIAPGMFKLDIEPISHRLKNNRDAHEVYLEKTIENTDTLRGLELLVYVSKTCPSLTKPTKKLVAVTPMNKDKKVRFVEPVTSSSNIPKQTDSLRTKDSNKPLLTSTGVNTTTSASGSKPSGNTKKNRISRPPSSNQKNKVEEHPRKVKSSLNKMNSVSKPISNAHVKHSVRNAKFESICAICNKCLFDANHDMCVIDYVNDVNVRSKSKSKRNKKRKVWKPIGKVFNEIGYSWKPTVCSRRPKAPKLVGSSSKSKITESRISNFSDPTQSGRSTVSDVPSSSLNDCTIRFGNDHIAKIMGYEDYQMGNVTISQYQKDHLCSACALGKSKKHSHKPKAEDSIQEKLYLLHMDLCGPIRIQSINGRKYILVIVDNYSRFTWVKFLRSKDEVPEFMIKFLKMIQVRLTFVSSGLIMALNLSIRHLKLTIKKSESHIKHLLLAPHNRIELSKDETLLLWKLPAPC
ncbi:retrovirus-related pol polyprotein from transposon TNT 1-94 [Tanacetum coccineum]